MKALEAVLGPVYKCCHWSVMNILVHESKSHILYSEMLIFINWVEIPIFYYMGRSKDVDDIKNILGGQLSVMKYKMWSSL